MNMKKRSKVFALMERTWREATTDWPNNRELTDAIWSLDDMLRAWLREWPTEQELIEYSQWDFITIAQDEVMNLFQTELAKEILAGNITHDDLVFALRVIWRYQSLVRQVDAADPDRHVSKLSWTRDGQEWSEAPARHVVSLGGLFNVAAALLNNSEVQRVRLSHGPASKPEVWEFSDGRDLVRWLYDGWRVLHRVALRLLMFELIDEYLAAHGGPDDQPKIHFNTAEEEFFKMPWQLQSQYLQRAITVVSDVQIADE